MKKLKNKNPKNLKKKINKRKIRKNPKFNQGDTAYLSIFGPNIKTKSMFEKGILIDRNIDNLWMFEGEKSWGVQFVEPDEHTLLTVEEFKNLKK